MEQLFIWTGSTVPESYPAESPEPCKPIGEGFGCETTLVQYTIGSSFA
jgi:hypothetical protein